MSVAECVDVENVEVGWSEEKILNELDLISSLLRILIFFRLTQVTICHGSKNRMDAMMYISHVDASDKIKVPNTGLVKRSLTSRTPLF